VGAQGLGTSTKGVCAGDLRQRISAIILHGDV
jgi:hypothetical protein